MNGGFRIGEVKKLGIYILIALLELPVRFPPSFWHHDFCSNSLRLRRISLPEVNSAWLLLLRPPRRTITNILSGTTKSREGVGERVSQVLQVGSGDVAQCGEPGYQVHSDHTTWIDNVV